MNANSVVSRWLPVATIVALAGWTGFALAQNKATDKKPEAAKAKTVCDVAMGAADLKTFCKLCDAAGLSETLKGKGPFTVLAPSDEAFKKLGKEVDDWMKPENKAKLTRILKNHVLDVRETSSELKAMKTAKTLAGTEVKLAVSADALMVETAKVTKADTEADNGVIHVVDAVLKPAEDPHK